jgi:hypothetical protein
MKDPVREGYNQPSLRFRVFLFNNVMVMIFNFF